jgi:PmbA protein
MTMQDLKTLAELLVNKCRDKGADAAELFIESGRNLRIEVRNGEVEKVEEAASHGAGFRLFVKGSMAFSHCNDLTDASLDNAIERAVQFARHTTPDENNVLPDDPAVTDVGVLFDPGLGRISLDEKIALAKKTEELALRDSRITKSDGARFTEGENDIFIANSHGLVKSYKESGCSFGVSIVAEKGEQKSDGGESCSRRFFADLKSVEEVAAKAAAEAYSMLDPRMVKTQRAAVIFDPDAARAILGGILAAVNGERVLQGASFLAERLESKIASELLTIIDDGTRARGLASAPFDGEGVPTQKRTIVEKGVLKGFMYNTIVAERAGAKSTGNASRGSYRSLPGIGAHSFFVAAGDAPPEEIVRATSRGLLLKGVTGYGINPVNGNFSGGASGFWIENGSIAFPVKGLTIAGTAEEMLEGIDMLGTDLDLDRIFTAPTLRIKELQIGGE